ncbi:hypothetical protein [uncultured Mycolicibacterium sp.]|uniref:hypothetical protein n=1 Tax=uncultured Mycolicibacterium sp. TaxID=2320817 RepID=UPI00260FE8B5|nr:hypothetical protein [uncultured Mycolicibacterium sp.]
MLARVRRILGFRVSVGELLVAALVLGVPYVVVGAVWAGLHTDHLHGMAGADLVVSYLGAIASWPVLLFSDVCMV